MNTITAPSIIMRVNDFGESDLLITFFTSENGKMKGIAKGARRSRARFVNCLDIFSLTSLEFTIKKKTSLHFIHSGKLLNAFPGLRKDYQTLIKASFMIELTEILFPWELPDRNMFDLLKSSFETLDNGDNPDLTPLLFEVTAMSLGGFRINFEKCCKCGREYTGKGTAAFRPDTGGIACLSCQDITKRTPGMSPETIRITNAAQTGLSETFASDNTSEEFFREIRPVLKLHREYRLERKPKSANYLE